MDDKYTVAVADFETDPFLFDRRPEPFAAGFMIFDKGGNRKFKSFWGDDCVNEFLDCVAAVSTPLTIYMHNGGKFDFFFMLARLENPMRVIGGRLVEAKFGIHRFRDSVAIMPMALKQYNKKEMDYAKMEREKRSKYRGEILDYLYHDCLYLHELCDAFVSRFGFKLTIAGTAKTELLKLHSQENLDYRHDKKFRPFFFGGRVECFDSGVIKGEWNVYDVNSMYPSVMRDFDHPLGRIPQTFTAASLDSQGWLLDHPGCMYFAVVVGHNRGALPVRTLTGLSFTETYGTFYVCSHELRTALELGLFDVESIPTLHLVQNTQRFVEFVEKFVAEKVAAKISGDKHAEIFSKFILNSAYGRFGIDPLDFKEWYIQADGDDSPKLTPYQERHDLEWTPHECNPQYMMWRIPKYNVAEVQSGAVSPFGFEDVAIAASITSAARSVLMRAIVAAKNPVYCDTDSIICESLDASQVLHDSGLGAWKLEATGNEISIAGKKLYSLTQNGEVVKMASKGVRISGDQIKEVALGGIVLWKSDAPNFSLTGGTRFVKRRAQSTSVKRLINSIGDESELVV